MTNGKIKLAQSMRPLTIAAQLVSFAIICGFLYWAQFVVVPVAIALLISFVLQPLVKAVECRFLPRPAAIALVMAAALCTVGALGWLLGSQLGGLLANMPKYSENITEKVSGLRGMTEDSTLTEIQETLRKIERDVERQASLREASRAEEKGPEGENPVEKVVEEVAEKDVVPVKVVPDRDLFTFTQSDFSATANVLFAVLLTLAFSALFLYWREDLVERSVGLAGHARILVTTQALSDAGTRISRYLALQFTVNVSYGILATTGLYFLGVPYAVVWGGFAGMLRYIPYVGSIVGTGCATLAAVVLIPGWETAVYVFLLYTTLDLSVNIIEPFIFGKGIGVSALAILFLVVILGWLWGPVGAFLATPVAVCLVVLGEYVPGLTFLTWLVSERPRQEPQTLFYHRLLRHDFTSAAKVLEEYESAGNEKRATIERVLVPTISQIDSDQKAGRLTQSEARNFAEVITDLLSERVRSGDQAPAYQDSGRSFTVCPASHPLDEAGLEALRWATSGLPVHMRFHPRGYLVVELMEELRRDPPDALILLATASDELRQVRRWIHHLESAGLDIPLVVFGWDRDSPMNYQPARLREFGARLVLRGFAELEEALTHPSFLPKEKVPGADLDLQPATSS